MSDTTYNLEEAAIEIGKIMDAPPEDSFVVIHCGKSLVSFNVDYPDFSPETLSKVADVLEKTVPYDWSEFERTES